MSKEFVVFETSNNCRVSYDPDVIDSLRGHPKAAVNPDVFSLRGIPKHFWKVVDGNVCLKTSGERDATMRDIAENGADNEIPALSEKVFVKMKSIQKMGIGPDELSALTNQFLTTGDLNWPYVLIGLNYIFLIAVVVFMVWGQK